MARRKRRKLDIDDVTITEEQTLKRATAAAAVGNAMEWYDFGVYAYIATVLAKVFFPNTGNWGLVAAYGAFTVSFVIRPIGGAFFGRLGDKIGRQKVLATTMLVMALGTLGIGFIPPYSSIGFLAPGLLLLARLVQGFSTGGEYGGAITYVSEYAPDKRRGFMSAFLDSGTLAGYSAGALLVTGLTTFLDTSALHSWGWRIPFFVAGPLGAIGLYVRLKLEDTPAFQKQQQEAAGREERQQRVSIREIIRNCRRGLLISIALTLTFNVLDYMLLTYMPSYMTDVLGAEPTSGTLLIVIVMLILLATTPFVGRLSDKIGRRPVILAGCIGLIALSWPALTLVQADNIIIRFIGLMIMGLMLLCFSSTMPATLPALFPTAVRYSAIAISFNVSVSVFGGTTPLVASALHQWGKHSQWAFTNDIPAFYLMLAGIIGVITMLNYHETAGQPLAGSTPSVTSEPEAAAVVRQYEDPGSELSRSRWGRKYAASRPAADDSTNEASNTSGQSEHKGKKGKSHDHSTRTR